jgi:beta-glucanase (GH16 family)
MNMKVFRATFTTLLTTAALLTAVALLVSLPGGAGRLAHADSGWNLVWSDEFNGNTAHNTQPGTGVDTSQWTYDIGQGVWGTGEIESMTNTTSNVYQEGGNLVIKALKDAAQANGPDKGWTSGRIETVREDFGAPAGGAVAFEASIQDPNLSGPAAAGYWPAFWMLGTPFRHGVAWPGTGEIDAMENVDGQNTEYGTLHCGTAPGGPCNEFNGRGGHTPCALTTCQEAFHTYRVEIDRSASPEQIRWYLDGQVFWHVSSTDPGMDATTWANAVDHPFFIIFDLAMGGGFPDAFSGGSTTPTTDTQAGGAMRVDYVRVYTMNPVATASPTVDTTVQPTATAMAQPTGTAVPPTATNTVVPPTMTSTSTSVPATATGTAVPPTSTSTVVPPTATSTSTALPVCQLFALPAFDTVPRGGNQALLVDAAPGSAITLTVRATYPAQATLYTDSSLAGDGFGIDLTGTRVSGGYRYAFNVETSGLALLTFAIPWDARPGTVVTQVAAQEPCGLFKTIMTFQVRGQARGAPGSRAAAGPVTLAITLPRGDAPPANTGALTQHGLLRVTTQGQGTTARRVLRITYHTHTRPAGTATAGAAHTRPHTLFGVAVGTGT